VACLTNQMCYRGGVCKQVLLHICLPHLTEGAALGQKYQILLRNKADQLKLCGYTYSAATFSAIPAPHSVPMSLFACGMIHARSLIMTEME